MQGVYVTSLVGAPRAHMPRHQKTKTQNKSNIVTNSIKTFKMVHIKKTTTSHHGSDLSPFDQQQALRS